MRILLVAQWVKLPGFEGAAAHHTAFVKALSEQGVEVHVLADAEDGKIPGAHVHPVNTKLPRPLLSYKTSWEIVDICKKEGIDVIHKRMDPGSGFSIFAAKNAKVPLVAEINFNPFSFERKGGILADAVKPAVQYYPRILWAKFFLSKADAVCCVSKSCANSLARHGIARNVSVIPNGVDLERFGKGMGKEAGRIKEKHHISGEVVEIVGGLGPRHGLPGIISVAGRLGTKFPNAKFLVVGGIERYKEHVEQMKKSAPANIEFAGRVETPDLPSYLSLADICIAPFQEALNPQEPYGFCPIKILEYMGSGKPIVASRLPWIEEILEDGKNALLFSNEKEMELALEKLLSDPKLREKMGVENRKKAEKLYSWEHVAREYVKVYRELMKKGKKPENAGI